jgi:alpha-tubulin suppressor-like RCC1 family protein
VTLPSFSSPGRPSSALRAGLLALVGAATVSCGHEGTAPAPSVDVASITIDQQPFLIERGFHQVLTATVKNKAGETVTIPVVWRSTNDAIATLDANGRLTAVDTGTVGVVASTLGASSQALGVRVVWQGAAKVAPYQFTAPGAASPSTTVPDSVRVLVTDRSGAPVPNARVAFAATAGGGTVSPAIAKTNTSGVAAAQWTLGNAAGANTVSATVLADDSAPLTFVASNPTSFTITTSEGAIVAVAGNSQSGQILSPLPVAPSVKVVDAAGNPRPGVPVTFTPTGGGRVASPAVSTGADGIASPGTWTLGDVTGDQTLVVKVEAASFTLHATGTGTALHYFPTVVVAGGSATCAIITNGTVDCWGASDRIGGGGSGAKSTPTQTTGGVRFASLAASRTHFCGVASDQSIYCWGVNALVDTAGHTADASVPTRLPSGLAWSKVAPAYQHNCAITTAQQAYCWGDNSGGQLGDATTTVRFAPAAVTGGFTFTTVVSGDFHTCGLAPDQRAYCWGVDLNGQLGDGGTTNRLTPTAVTGGLTFQSIGAGRAWTCGLTPAGRVYCWGFLSNTTTAQTTPTTYATAPAFTTLSVGSEHACALTADGSAYCWGNNAGGQLGDSTTTFRNDPTPVSGTFRFSTISAGYQHTCARTTDGAVVCWGFNSAGELGDNVAGIRPTPRYIVTGVNP